MQPNGWVCPYLTQSWVQTTQQFLERDLYIKKKVILLFIKYTLKNAGLFEPKFGVKYGQTQVLG